MKGDIVYDTIVNISAFMTSIYIIHFLRRKFGTGSPKWPTTVVYGFLFFLVGYLNRLLSH